MSSCVPGRRITCERANGHAPPPVSIFRLFLRFSAAALQRFHSWNRRHARHRDAQIALRAYDDRRQTGDGQVPGARKVNVHLPTSAAVCWGQPLGMPNMT
eukprot:6286711-Prymnesium_polylepis.1